MKAEIEKAKPLWCYAKTYSEKKTKSKPDLFRLLKKKDLFRWNRFQCLCSCSPTWIQHPDQWQNVGAKNRFAIQGRSVNLQFFFDPRSTRLLFIVSLASAELSPYNAKHQSCVRLSPSFVLFVELIFHDIVWLAMVLLASHACLSGAHPIKSHVCSFFFFQ